MPDADRPCSDQNEEATSQWMMANARAGLIVIVRTTQGGIWEYRLDEITAVNEPTKGRIYLRQAGSFYFNGKNCHHPKGQTRLLVPTDAVLRAAIDGRIWVNGDMATRTLSEAERSLAERVITDKPCRPRSPPDHLRRPR